MRLFEHRIAVVLDTLKENTNPTVVQKGFVNPQIAQTPQQTGQQTIDYPSPGPVSNSNQLAGVPEALDQIRNTSKANMTIDQKLDLVLKKVDSAERVSYLAVQKTDEFDRKLKTAIDSLSSMITRVSQGQTPHQPNTSIWDDDSDEVTY